MSFLEMVILSLIQGVTEFLPISSSGHLVLAQAFLGLGEVPVLFDLILHLGTASATVLVYHRLLGDICKDIFLWIIAGREKKHVIYSRGNVKLAAYVLLSTAVTGLLGLVFRDFIKAFFQRPLAASFFLLLTGIVLMLTRFVSAKGDEIENTKLGAPLFIGGAQALAMLPGISRSGITISTGLYLGMSRQLAGSYSFILSIPSILGASVVEFISSAGTMQDLFGGHGTMKPSLFILSGFLISLLTGYISLRLLLSFLRRGKLYLFSYYCFPIAVLSAVAVIFLL
jgi:undecaprenyl-diphosphatase